MSLLQQLSIAPINCPTTRNFHIFFSPGRIHLEMCVDRPIVYYGDKFDLHVANNSNKTIRNIKCQLTQVSLFPFVGERRTPFSFLETTEGCPIPPGASRYIVRNLLRNYAIWTFQNDVIGITISPPSCWNRFTIWMLNTNPGEVSEKICRLRCRHDKKKECRN